MSHSLDAGIDKLIEYFEEEIGAFVYKLHITHLTEKEQKEELLKISWTINYKENNDD